MTSLSERGDPFQSLARVLDTLPSGFPSTGSGVEIRLLRRIFTPQEAALFCDLLLTLETPAEIAARTRRPLSGLSELLLEMWRKGQIAAEGRGQERRFRMLPFIFGIFEGQLGRMDHEMAELFESYAPAWGVALVRHLPQLFLVLPVESVLRPHHHALPFHRVSAILEEGRSFWVRRCVCRTQKQQLGEGCKSPMETCLGIGRTRDSFADYPFEGRAISRAEALDILREAEQAGLVHNTHNVRRGHTFICNCCGCCCGLLVASRRFGISQRAFNTHYYAELDVDTCEDCGVCSSERCPVDAIRRVGQGLRVDRRQCLGCGLCVTTCPTGAISLRARDKGSWAWPPQDELEWMEERAQARNRGFDAYR